MDKILFLISASQVKVIRYTRRNAKKWRPSLSEFETLSLRTTDAVTSSPDHGSQVPTTEGLEKCCLVVERGHRSRESREGDLEHRASQGCLRYRQRSSYNVQGSFPPSATIRSEFTHIQDPTTNGLDLIELGLYCADICRALDRGLNGKELSDLSQSVCEAINQLTM